MELITVASSGNVMITNAAVSPGGRLFGNFPRWTDVPTPSVGEAMAGGGFAPFPGGDWNEWRPGLPPHERFVCTHGLYADRDDNLWAIDDASPHHGPMVEGGVKLVKIDLATNRVSRIHALGPDLAQKERVLGRNAVEFFGLDNLPEPSAVKAARSGWTRDEPRETAAAQGALR